MLQFVAHASCQQKLVSIWYNDLRAMERSNWFFRSLMVFGVTTVYPLLAMLYIFAPHSKVSLSSLGIDPIVSQSLLILVWSVYYSFCVQISICKNSYMHQWYGKVNRRNVIAISRFCFFLFHIFWQSQGTYYATFLLSYAR